MKLNNKGYTLIELLAAVTIMAILSGAAIVSYTRYQDKVRKEAYAAMEQSAFSAAQNYIQDRKVYIPTDPGTKTIDVTALVDAGYLSRLEDPRDKESTCHTGSTVKVSKTKSSGTTLEKYTFIVTIKCNGYTSSRTEGATTVEGKIFKS